MGRRGATQASTNTPAGRRGGRPSVRPREVPGEISGCTGVVHGRSGSLFHLRRRVICTELIRQVPRSRKVPS